MSLVREAVKSDAAAIMRLLQRVPYSHVHVDWRLPADWIGSPGFVVFPEPDFVSEQRRSVFSRFLHVGTGLRGCLAVAADPPPAAWVRVASVAAVEKPVTVLEAMLERVKSYLRETAVSELGWLAIREWPNAWLPDLGFFRANEIETYWKTDSWLPRVTAVPQLEIRPARAADMAALEQLESKAFEPLWRYSADTLILASRQALCFDVAVLGDRIVGFQLSAATERGAHLVRLTVDPDLHQRGVGSALLADAIMTYYNHGYRQVSLNTQVDNMPSQYLYRKFGFKRTGQRLPVWVLPL